MNATGKVRVIGRDGKLVQRITYEQGEELVRQGWAKWFPRRRALQMTTYEELKRAKNIAV